MLPLMKPKRRWILVGAVLVLVLAAGVGVWVLWGTRAALERAEAFEFQRMEVSRLDSEGTHRFHYVTNRRPAERDGPIAGRFASERGERLEFGSFDARIERSVGLGMLFDQDKWFRDQEIGVVAERPLSREAFVEGVRELVRKSPQDSLLVVVHGYREAFDSALRKTAFVGHVLDINTPVLLFDWPGDQPGGPVRSYRSAFEVAEASGADLARTLELLIDEIAPGMLWLVANSMGGQVVAEAFGVLYAEADLADSEVELEDVVLTAPDVDLEEFDQRFKQEINALARNLTVYVSSNDRALLASRILNRGPRRGESTLRTRSVSTEQLDAAIRLAELMDPGSELISLVDVTPVNRTRNFHNFYLETPEVYNDLFQRLTNAANPRSRLLYPVYSRTGDVYWILTRGR